jgi:hypothetical protein
MTVDEQAFHDRTDDALALLATDDRPFRELFTRATHLVGDEPIVTLSGNWPRDTIARAFLLREAASRIDILPLVEDLFRHGDAREQQAIVRALPLLPTPERYVPLARTASRTNVVTVFEALACNNPYPSRYLPDDAFAQLVMRVLVVGLPLAHVIGLRQRVNVELRRMARDYASERRAAGRVVPRDLDLIFVEGVA